MKPKRRSLILTVPCLTLLLTHGATQAAVVFVSGSLTNDIGSQISNWSAASTTKTRDINSDNRYGSDGYTWMNAANDSGGVNANALANIVESAPSYTGGIAYTGATTGGASAASGSFSGADDRLLPNGTGSANVGYAGVNYNGAAGNPQNTMQQLFAYTMNRSMNPGETIRLGVVLDSLNDNVVGADALRVVAGGTADATLSGNRSGVMDMYFFDITGLNSGEQIQIWGSKSVNTQNFGFRAITIGGVTFDSIPEPSAALLGAFGMLALLRRRR